MEQIRSGRLRSVQQGRARLIPAAAIRDYVARLEREAQETRYDKTARNFLAAIHLAAAILWLN